MAYTVTELITKSWYLSGIVSRRLQKPTTDQITEGLDLLNALLAFKTANTRLIPYYTSYSTNAVIGQETYFIPNLVEAETFTFNLQTIRFSTNRQGRKVYFGSPRVDGIQALPFDAHFERILGGSNLFLYFLPSDTFVLKIFGKFSFSSVTLNQDLELTLDDFFIEYLRYALASKMCADYNIVLAPEAAQELREYEEVITYISPKDLQVLKKSTLQTQSGINWAYVNFPGWVPSP